MAISEKTFYWIMAGFMFIIGSSLIIYEPSITANVVGTSSVDSSTVTLIGLAFIIVGFLLFVLVYTSKHHPPAASAPNTGMGAGTVPPATPMQPQTTAPATPAAPATPTVPAATSVNPAAVTINPGTLVEPTHPAFIVDDKTVVTKTAAPKKAVKKTVKKAVKAAKNVKKAAAKTAKKTAAKKSSKSKRK